MRASSRSWRFAFEHDRRRCSEQQVCVIRLTQIMVIMSKVGSNGPKTTIGSLGERPTALRKKVFRQSNRSHTILAQVNLGMAELAGKSRDKVYSRLWRDNISITQRRLAFVQALFSRSRLELIASRSAGRPVSSVAAQCRYGTLCCPIFTCCLSNRTPFK